MPKKSFLTPLGFVRQNNSPKPYYCSPSIIIKGNFHLSKHLRERFYRFFQTINNDMMKYIVKTLIEQLIFGLPGSQKS